MEYIHVIDRKRVLVSLGWAVAAASAGFGLIFVLFAWITYRTAAWFCGLSPAAQALLGKVPASTVIPFLAMLPAMGARAGMMTVRKKRATVKRQADKHRDGFNGR